MKRLILLLTVLMGTGMNLRTAAQATQYAFRISFTDKTGAPAAQLSPRSLARRAAQGIALNIADQPVSPDYIDSVIMLTGGKMHVTSRWFNQMVVLLTDSSQMQAIRNKPYISSTAWVALFAPGIHKPAGAAGTGKNEAPLEPLPPTAEKTTGTPAFYAATWNQTHLVNGDYLHDLGYMGQGKLIVVLDEGFNDVDTHFGFDSLRTGGRIVDVHNFLRASNLVYDYSVHGTSCLSTMAGYAPSVYLGSAPFATYALYVTEWSQEQPVEMDQMIAGLERADSLGADVVSNSLGYNFFTGPFPQGFQMTDLDGHTTLVARGMNVAAEKGMLVVTSAGNEGGNSWNFLLTPGDADSALTIGAVGPDRNAWDFSSPGPNASGRIKPDVVGQGSQAAVFGTNNAVYSSSGTSFSTPQIAGFAACLWQAAPNASPAAIREAIRRSADRYTSPTGKLGYGIPDFRKALASLGVKNLQASTTKPLQVWPNPLQNQTLHIGLPMTATQQVQLAITDAQGRTIASTGMLAIMGNLHWTLSQPLPPGIYFLRATVGSLVYSGRLLRQ